MTRDPDQVVSGGGCEDQNQQGGVGGGTPVSQEIKTESLINCHECGKRGVSRRHFFKDSGRCRNIWIKRNGQLVMRGLPMVSKEKMAIEDHETERKIETLLARYSPVATEDFESLDADDWRTIRTVFDYLFSHRGTGALLPAKRRLEIAEELNQYPALQIAFACDGFLRGRCIESRKPFNFFMGIVRPGASGRGGSAAEKYAEVMSERRRNGKFRLEVK